MSTRILGAIAVGVVCAVGSTYAFQLHANDDRAAALSRYYTFFILQGSSSGSDVTDQRIRADLLEALDARGWVDVQPNEAEAVVVTHTATAADRSYQSFYQGWGGWSWKDGPTAAALTRDYTPGTLVVDIFDARSKRLLWSGVANGAAAGSHDKSGRGTEEAVGRMFRTLPDAEPAGQPVKTSGTLWGTDPSSNTGETPRIIFSRAPAWLIRIDGEPDYRAIDGVGLDRVVNARPFIVRDSDGTHYLKIADGWMQAYTLTGMWSVAGTVPRGAVTALAQAVQDKTVDLLEGGTLGGPPDRRDLATAVTPTVYVATTPATLIATEGEPQFAPIDGTPLLSMTNTTAHVLKEPTDQELYVRVSGEWYRAWATDGPWEHVAQPDLPADLSSAGDLK